MQKLIQNCISIINLEKDPFYNLSKYGEFFNEEIKPSEQFKQDLKDACKEYVKLKDDIKAFIEKCVFNGKVKQKVILQYFEWKEVPVKI